jgi:Dolichyl-phosphate-mannose-protein mannosyltransferase
MDESLESQTRVAAEPWIMHEAGRGFAFARRLLAARKAEAVCTALLLIMAANLFGQISRKSLTNDEMIHIPAGYYHLVAGYFQLNNEHPPLVKMWAALPLLFIQPNEPPPAKDEAEHNMNLTWRYQARFWSDNAEHFEAIIFWTRAFMIVLTLFLGTLIFLYARDLFGPRAACLAVALFTFEPTVLAHGRIVHTDMSAAMVYLLFFFVVRRYWQQPSWRRALLVGLASGIALATKFSMIIVLPLLAGLALAGTVFAARLKLPRKQLLVHTAFAFLMVLMIVNAAYYFRRPPVTTPDVAWVKLQSPEKFDQLMAAFHWGSTVVPTYFLFGFYNFWLHTKHGHPTALLGHYSSLGWWYYFPVAFALKTSLPFLLVSIAALFWALWRLLLKRDYRFLWLMVPLLIYVTVSMISTINIGVRHFLPAFMFLFIMSGALLDRLLRVRYPRHLAVALVVLLLSWTTVEALRSYPDYVPYLNQLASNHPHWWYLSDSNVEWGDDARELATYLHARGETEVRGAISGGWGTLARYGIAYHEIFPKPGVEIPETNYVAIGASFLNGSTNAVAPDANGHSLTEEQRVNYLDVYRTMKPEAIIGNSIYLYRVK